MLSAIKLLLSAAAHGTALAVLLFLTWRVRRNLVFLRSGIRLTPRYKPQPRVSVLVPVRDEERSIRACIESLVTQDYGDFEIIALNDQSSDATRCYLDDLAAKHPQVTVIHGDERPPSGWNGKSFACHRLAQNACGEWLLFTDADTVHSPQSITRGVAQAKALDADLLSVFPKQQTQSLSEHMMVSFIMDFLPLLGVDLAHMVDGEPSGIIANGQYMLVRAEIYHALGGHAAIGTALVDDFALAQHFQQHNYPLAMVNGVDILTCRMYHNSREVWSGFSKNLLLGLETSAQEARSFWWALLFAWSYAALFIVPLFNLLFDPPTRPLAIIEIAWLWTLRVWVGRAFQRPLREAFMTPFAAIGVMLLGMNALLRRVCGQSVVWKGRQYSLDA